MSDAVGFVKTVKRAAVEAVNAEKPVEVCFGMVTGVSPLEILVEQKMKLGEAQLILSRNVTDYITEVSAAFKTESVSTVHSHAISGYDSMGGRIDLVTEEAGKEHAHEIAGRMEVTVYNGLAVGNEVILIRQQGGQKYVVVDRIG